MLKLPNNCSDYYSENILELFWNYSEKCKCRENENIIEIWKAFLYFRKWIRTRVLSFSAAFQKYSLRST